MGKDLENYFNNNTQTVGWVGVMIVIKFKTSFHVSRYFNEISALPFDFQFKLPDATIRTFPACQTSTSVASLRQMIDGIRSEINFNNELIHNRKADVYHINL